MRVDAIESTPNPSAFLLRLDEPLEGFDTTSVRGQTFKRGWQCPASLAAAVDIDGVESLFVTGGAIVTVCKQRSTK